MHSMTLRSRDHSILGCAREASFSGEGRAMAVGVQVKRWTLQELHSLPDDGNRYELIDGELFVTPPPTDAHETIAARLSRILDPYVAEHKLGLVFRPRAVLRFRGSQAEPDLMVRQEHPRRSGKDTDWDRAPTPILVVEIASSYTRRRDREQKRDYYRAARVAEYWIVDQDSETVAILRAGSADQVIANRMRWHPTGAMAPLEFDVRDIWPNR
jgi:Uma2 family endonuclease